MKRKLSLPTRPPKQRDFNRFARLTPDAFAAVADHVFYSHGVRALVFLFQALFYDLRCQRLVINYCAKLAVRFGWREVDLGDSPDKLRKACDFVICRLQNTTRARCAFCGKLEPARGLTTLRARVSRALGLRNDLEACRECWLARYPEQIAEAKECRCRRDGSPCFSPLWHVYDHRTLHLVRDIPNQELGLVKVIELVREEYGPSKFWEPANWAVRCFSRQIPPETPADLACERFLVEVEKGAREHNDKAILDIIPGLVAKWRARLALLQQ